MSAFFLYKQEVYPEVKKKNPETKITQITQIISEMWKGVDADTKARFEKLAEKKKQEYDNDKKTYEDKYGKIAKKPRKKKGSDDEDDSEKETKKKAKTEKGKKGK